MDWTLQTVLPIAALAGAAAVLPWAFHRFMEDTIRALWIAITASTGALTVMGAAIFAVLYTENGLSFGAMQADPLGAAGHFLSLGLRASLVWLPVLALSGISLGQRIEARRGAAMAARDPD